MAINVPFRSMFSAKWWQVSTYLFGVALFSISFLVFLNSSISFVVTDLIGQNHAVGDAVGSLGFADELVALIACPFWGLISDRLGVRLVCVLGYGIVGISLLVFVQAKNVYPQLLLARVFFSVGGAATSTMVTAILPNVTARQTNPRIAVDESSSDASEPRFHAGSVSSTPTITPETYHSSKPAPAHSTSLKSGANTSRVAGLVGMFTGVGALIALGLFLPLPKRFQDIGNTPADAVKHSFYVVGIVAFVVAIICGVGLSNLAGESHKGFRFLFGRLRTGEQNEDGFLSRGKTNSYLQLLTVSISLGVQDMQIGLGYLGGFVARASSVGVSLFISLYVNNYFIATGRCNNDPHLPPSEVNEQCRRAYLLAAELSGVSQLIALLCAPLFGFLDGRYHRFNAPLLVAAVAGVVGYIAFARIPSPDPKSEEGGPAIFFVMALLGISQIGAIVCSLSLLGRGINDSTEHSNVDKPDRSSESLTEAFDGATAQEDSALLARSSQGQTSRPLPSSSSRAHLKGSIAGVYSLAGGAGILILTKLGGYLFDRLSPGAPFYMLSIFNGILLIIGLGCVLVKELKTRRHEVA
ncbi:MAG: hypothetical protein M1828_006245 [Chrysothrix sp. TS-e1954]|nr:MAG: hypothetical protein M1828_006245 [Chrysothrix sp. TS-e1954]